MKYFYLGEVKSGCESSHLDFVLAFFLLGPVLLFYIMLNGLSSKKGLLVKSTLLESSLCPCITEF